MAYPILLPPTKEANMGPNFKPYKTFNALVEERCPCGGHGDGLSKGRRLVCYLYKRELCGKEFILSADEVAKHLYSVGARQNQERRRTSPRLMRRSKPF